LWSKLRAMWNHGLKPSERKVLPLFLSKSWQESWKQ
jgi:hypothetical protein